MNDEQSIIWLDSETLVEVYNNVFYVTSENLDPGNSPTYKFWNNIFNFTTEPNWGSCEYANNCYYPIAKNNNDPHGISANPGFVMPGFMNDGRNNRMKGNDAPRYYKLLPNSPCIDAGKGIPDNGSRDYWGTELYQGLPDIGATEYSN